MEIRAKDKLFLLTIVPLAAVAAYFWLWRFDTARRISSLEQRRGQLVEKADYPVEKKRAERALAQAQAELERERAAEPPRLKVKGERGESAAERERAVLEVFREAGLTMRRSAAPDASAGGDAASAGVAVNALRRSGLRPAPMTRRYVLDGRYPQLVKALAIFAEREMAVVVTTMEMSGGDVPRWTLELTL